MIASVHAAIKVASLAVAAGLPLALLTGPPLAAGHYTTIKVPGGTNVSAEGISDSGVIVGCDKRKAGGRGFVEKGKKFTVLADPKAGAKGSTCPSAINSRGVVVGEYDSGTDFHGFVLDGGHYTTLDEPHAGTGVGEGTVAVDVNDSGVIVGHYIDSHHAEFGFVLRNGKFTSFSIPAPVGAKHPRTVLNGISDNGTMTGIYFDDSGANNSFTIHGANLRGISVPGAKITSVACISEHSGLIVGDYQTSKTGPSRGFTFSKGIYRTLRAAPGQKSTLPQCGNDHGDVAGFTVGASDTISGFLFTPRK